MRYKIYETFITYIHINDDVQYEVTDVLHFPRPGLRGS